MERLLNFYCIEECRTIAKTKLVGQSVVPNSGDHIPIHGKDYRVILRKMPPVGDKSQHCYMGSIDVVVAPVNHLAQNHILPDITEWVFTHNSTLNIGSMVKYTDLDDQELTLMVLGLCVDSHGLLRVTLNGSGKKDDYNPGFSGLPLSDILPA
ncbi:TPA: hypothetical protein I7730_15680 [Vibrio vulnificus]|uniref:Uncharacterized protein n=1 Tax=Vibrio vulnificus TaxID=672 RepID=A0A8H9TG02_VIBVL|nr:hypothetical protein [Vibrio vulnificus]HAS8541222.1 hypothetical protein [Vibrio vulnificus]